MVELANKPQTTTPADPEKPKDPELQTTTEKPADPERDRVSSQATSTISDGEDLLGDLGADDSAGDIEGEGQAKPVLLSRDEFFGVFRFTISAPNMVISPALKSLNISKEDQAARDAAEAIYDIALEVDSLRFLIEPGNKWIKRAAAIGGFGFGMYMSVTAELAARKPKDPPKQKRQADGPANDNPPPPPADEGPGVDQGVKELKVSHAP